MKSQRLWTMLCPGVSCALALLGLVLISGCGVSSASSEQVRAWGRITFRGEPVTGGAIIFMPAENGHTNWGVGQIDDQGRYKLSTYLANAPLQSGPYHVFLKPRITTRLRQVDKRSRKKEEQDSEPADEVVPDEGKIPKRFLDPQTSGILVILDHDANQIDIDLKE